MLLTICPFILKSQDVDTLLLLKIENRFTLGKSVNIEFKFYYHHPTEEISNRDILKTILYYLKENKSVKIELISHSDCRGNKDYNRALTKRQAEKIRTWLISNGISKNRIISLGAGGEFPLVECKNCNCTDDLHRKNRRIEIRKLE